MMKRKIILVSAISALLSLMVISAVLLAKPEGSTGEGQRYENLYVCSMHPWEASEGPGSCAICGMKLSQVHGHPPGDPLPAVSELFVSPDDPLYVQQGAGTDPKTGAKLIPITESPYYQPQSEMPRRSDHDLQQPDSDTAEGEATLWTCGMHPDVLQEEPGICPICQMELTPLKASTASRQGAVVEIDPVTLQNIGVVTEQVQLRSLSREIRTNGTIEVAEDAQVRVNARVSGWLEKLHVGRTGDAVRKDQPLLEIYSPELVSAQEEYLIALESAETLKSGGLGRVSGETDELVEAAEQRLRLWDITQDQVDELKASRRVKRTLTLVSPIEGVLLHKNVVEGSAVQPGMDLFLIADLSRVWLIGQVYEYELPWVRTGNPVEVTSSYDPHLRTEGIIEYIYPTLDAKNRSAQFRAVLPNPDLKFKPEMYVEANLVTAPVESVVSVSKPAVIRSGKRDIVFVAQGEGRFEPRQVHVGMETDLYYEIPHGLQVGEEVVTSAQFLLDSEAKLQEAIQRRLEQRRQSTGGSVTTEEDLSGSQAGHVH